MHPIKTKYVLPLGTISLEIMKNNAKEHLVEEKLLAPEIVEHWEVFSVAHRKAVAVLALKIKVCK